MRLVEGWRKAWRWFSMHFFVVLGTLPVVWSSLPEDVRDMLPEAYRPWVLTLIALGGIVARLIPQDGTGDEVQVDVEVTEIKVEEADGNP